MIYQFTIINGKKGRVSGKPGRGGAGFTLIELMVAIGVVGLVFGVIISSISAINKKSRDQQRVTDLQSIQSALAQYYADQTFYPDSSFNVGTELELNDNIGNPQVAVASKFYLTRIPREPRSTTPAYCYTPQASFSGGACDNDPTTPTASCQYYQLCAQLENGATGTPNCATGCSTYNFVLNPNRSGQ